MRNSPKEKKIITEKEFTFNRDIFYVTKDYSETCIDKFKEKKN